MQSPVLIVSYAFTQGSMKSKRCLFSLLLFLRNEKKKNHFEGLIINDMCSELQLECSGLSKTNIILPQFFRESLFISI